MRSLPDGLDMTLLRPALVDGWGLQPAAVDYVAVGFGSYHWSVRTSDAERYFVTVDDLDSKPWLGATRDDSFAGLTAAFDTVGALRADRGLEFALAPVEGIRRESLRRIDDRYAVAVFPWVEGGGGRFDEDLSPAERCQALDLLADLHRAAPPSTGLRTFDPGFARECLEPALDQVDTPWQGGPYSEPARTWLAHNSARLRQRLQEFDRLAEALSGRAVVVTHGEPHPGNLMRTSGGLVLVDWDTVALAPPERDLWMLAPLAQDEVARYAEATGHLPDEAALELYSLAWDLADLAEYVALFRSPHPKSEDTDQAWDELNQINLERAVSPTGGT